MAVSDLREQPGLAVGVLGHLDIRREDTHRPKAVDLRPDDLPESVDEWIRQGVVESEEVRD